MTDTALAEAKPKHSRTPDKQRVTARVRAAIEAMVWSGLQRRDAAAAADLAEHSLYQALRRPPVKALYLAELQVLRDSERARSFHTLCDVRDQTDNQMARVQAVKAMYPDEQMLTERGNAGISSPGVTIRVVTVLQQGTKSDAIPTYQNSMSLTEPNDIKQIDHEPR